MVNAITATFSLTSGIATTLCQNACIPTLPFPIRNIFLKKWQMSHTIVAIHATFCFVYYIKEISVPIA